MHAVPGPGLVIPPKWRPSVQVSWGQKYRLDQLATHQSESFRLEVAIINLTVTQLAIVTFKNPILSKKKVVG